MSVTKRQVKKVSVKAAYQRMYKKKRKGLSADASDESRQNKRALRAVKGIQLFAEAQARASVAEQKDCGLVVLFDLQGKGPKRKRSFSADLIFW